MESHNEEMDSLEKLYTMLAKIDHKKLHVPPVPPNYFHFDYNEKLDPKQNFNFSEKKLVLADSNLVEASLLSARRLTTDHSVKESLELTFRFEDEVLEYCPGDSFGFLCSNDPEEVNSLIERLNLHNVADAQISVIFSNDTSSKKKLPIIIPPFVTLKEIFLHCIEIRSLPKKILFRILADFASDENEQKLLLYLSSSEGSGYFAELIRKPSLSVLDILHHFTSCNPPVEKLIECLPPLRPRFYSLASSPLVERQTFKILFNVLQIPKGGGRQEEIEGVCTGWFKKLASRFLCSSSDMIDKFSGLKLEENVEKIFLYKRKNSYFKFPDELEIPIIMVGPGTGIAPFIGYLQHRAAVMKLHPNKTKGETWLFYGCRFKDKDFLYKSDLETFVHDGVLNHLVPTFSRDSQPAESPKYVQDNIISHSHQLAESIRNGNILVCGESTNMAPDVQKAFVKAVQIGFDVNETEAKSVIDGMLKEHRYVNDVWA